MDTGTTMQWVLEARAKMVNEQKEQNSSGRGRKHQAGKGENGGLVCCRACCSAAVLPSFAHLRARQVFETRAGVEAGACLCVFGSRVSKLGPLSSRKHHAVSHTPNPHQPALPATRLPHTAAHLLAK